MTDEVWKVGQLARETGLTVRTLHHYDELGLIRPSHRTAAGHRLYDEQDVDRLYRVIALRRFGLGLDQIASVLDEGADWSRVLAAHRDVLDGHIRELQRTCVRLTTLLDQQRRPTATDFLQLIKEVTMSDETMQKYFDSDQIAALDARRQQVGDAHIHQVQQAWPVLIAKVDRAVADGTDPQSEQGQQLAREWQELLTAFHGGDDGLRDALFAMQADNAEQLEQQHGGPSQAALDFIGRASA
ncbi:MAG: MerR family transcriptional regulator [Propionibacteriales bacterium]|nr:MerR family transcriptional regulator [Propionibacteriales bacterium]